MSTRIVFVGGREIEVETPIQNVLRLFDDADRSGLSFAAAEEASLRCFVNREQVLYLEAAPDQPEKPFWVTARPGPPPEVTLGGFSGAPPRRQHR